MRCKSLRSWTSIVMIALIALSLPVVAQEADKKDRASSMLERGMRQFQKGKYEQATGTFNKLLELQPDSQQVLALRREAELKQLVEMAQVEDEQLSAVASRLLEMMTEAVRQRKKHVDNPEKIRSGMQSPDLDTYLQARVDALSYGPYVIPELLPLLTGKGAKAQKVVGRAMSTLVGIGRRATLPLIAVLQSKDQMLPARAANVLGQVGDVRAVPALLTIHKDKNRPGVQRTAAKKAIESITGQPVSELGDPRQQYIDLVWDYLEEDEDTVGYVFGVWAEVWNWNQDAESLEDRLTYVEVPGFLYHQRQGSAFARQALSTQTGCAQLQSLLVATLVRELEKARMYADRGKKEKLIQSSKGRVKELEKRIPVLSHLYEASVVARSLEHVMDVNDPSSSYYLVMRLGQKAGVAREKAMEALTRATHFGGREARYRAAIELIKASPMGRVPEPDQVMQVIAAALRQTVQRTALIVSNDLQFRNKLRKILEDEGVSAAECDANVAAIGEALNLNPSVDVVFVYGNVSDETFNSVYGKLKRDGRTENKAAYVIRDPGEASPNMADYEGIRDVMPTDSLRKEPIAGALDEAFKQSTVLTSPGAAKAVLRAAEALKKPPYAGTRYPLYVTEPALVSALGTHTDSVTLAAAKNLGRFGSKESLEPLAKVIHKEDTSAAVRRGACLAIAAIVEREGEYPKAITKNVVACFESSNQTVREAGAEALSLMKLSKEKMLEYAQDVLRSSLKSENAE